MLVLVQQVRVFVFWVVVLVQQVRGFVGWVLVLVQQVKGFIGWVLVLVLQVKGFVDWVLVQVQQVRGFVGWVLVLVLQVKWCGASFIQSRCVVLCVSQERSRTCVNWVGRPSPSQDVLFCVFHRREAIHV